MRVEGAAWINMKGQVFPLYWKRYSQAGEGKRDCGSQSIRIQPSRLVVQKESERPELQQLKEVSRKIEERQAHKDSLSPIHGMVAIENTIELSLWDFTLLVSLWVNGHSSTRASRKHESRGTKAKDVITPSTAGNIISMFTLIYLVYRSPTGTNGTAQMVLPIAHSWAAPF